MIKKKAFIIGVTFVFINSFGIIKPNSSLNAILGIVDHKIEFYGSIDSKKVKNLSNKETLYVVNGNLVNNFICTFMY